MKVRMTVVCLGSWLCAVFAGCVAPAAVWDSRALLTRYLQGVKC
jgi:hypothetical protein